jgi:SAM-dependent methyltransferase
MDSSDAAAFDGKARDYDAEFTATGLGSVLRVRVWDRLSVVFAGRERLLELGCGTGEDAVWMARAGHRVVAIDASAEMIRVARQKALAAGCADRIEFHHLPMERLHELPCEGRFDGVFSNFGAINCLADVEGLSRTLSEMLVAGAPLLFVVMGRYVPWEWAWYLARGDARKAFRRFAKSGAAWRGLTIHYPTPSEMARKLSPLFIARRRSALGFALPPSYAGAWLERSAGTFRVLEVIERAVCRFTAGLADHFVLEATTSART